MDVLSATDAALAELASLRERHGPLMLFQSGGCCDGSSPLCLHEGELLLGASDLIAGPPRIAEAAYAWEEGRLGAEADPAAGEP